jgi:hypothetical protein
MIKPDIDELGVQERVLLFCLASGTDWNPAGVASKTLAGMVTKFLVTVTWSSHRLALTDAGRAALRTLLRDL